MSFAWVSTREFFYKVIDTFNPIGVRAMQPDILFTISQL